MEETLRFSTSVFLLRIQIILILQTYFKLNFQLSFET